MVGLFAYLLPIYAAAPRPGPGSGTDRAPGIVFARHRQVQVDVPADDRPLPRPELAALPSTWARAVRVPELVGALPGGEAGEPASRSVSPGSSRGPPAA
jgi:hypothetical protein